jgi:heptosyltransferase II
MKLLVELPTWMGDTVMATPAIENLFNFYKSYEVTIIGSFVSIELIKNNPRVINSYVLDKSYRSILNARRTLGKFDIFYSFRETFRSYIFKKIITSSKKYSFKKKEIYASHQVEKYNNFINSTLNMNFQAGKLKLHTNLKLPEIKNKPIIGINPGSSYGSSKRWYPERFAESALSFSNNFDIFIFGGDNEVNIALDIEKLLISKGVVNCRNLAGKTSVQELVSFISNLDVFVTGDSGPMHIAASFGIPTVSLFGPTRDYETSQWLNSSNVIVKKNLDCQPCMKRSCPLNHHNCMKLIEASEVINAIESLKY